MSARGEDGPLPGPGCFVTGTDTGVGKTLVACALVRALRLRGDDVGVVEPIETGVGAEGPLDARALREAAGSHDALDEICPERFALPAAPTVAARHEGREVDLEALHRSYRALARRHGWMLVEGAGGLLVPVADGVSMANLAEQLGLPLLVVARASLGTINHTLLTLEAIASRGLPLAGVVVSFAQGPLCAADAANLQALRRAVGERLVGEVPPLASGAAPDDALIDLERLAARLRSAASRGVAA